MVECRLGDGRSGLDPGEAQDIVGAGLSGESMAILLARVAWVRDKNVNLVLLPAARGPGLRKWLCQNGFGIIREVPVKEHGRFYTAILAAYTGEAMEPAPLFYQVGLVPRTKNEAAAGYVTARLKQLKQKRGAPLDETERAELETLISEVEACLP